MGLTVTLLSLLTVLVVLVVTANLGALQGAQAVNFDNYVGDLASFTYRYKVAREIPGVAHISGNEARRPFTLSSLSMDAQ
jgi:hypothetical protein